MEDRKIRVAITIGDANGVGYEVIAKAFEDLTMLELCTPIIYGSPKVAAYHSNAMQLPMQFSIINQAEEAQDGRVNMLTVNGEEIKIDLGKASNEAALLARQALDRAMQDFKEGLFDVLVTAPVNAACMDSFDSHEDYLKAASDQQTDTLTIVCSEELRVAMVTDSMPLKDITSTITQQTIESKARLLHQALKRDFNISSPRIAVLSLNPSQEGEEQQDSEENTIIAPAVASLAESGIQAFGPYPADNFFGNLYYQQFDAVLAMYHDQAMTPFKTIVGDDGIVLTTALPIVHTMPGHGTLYDIAGKGVADAEPMRHAIFMAIDVLRNRLRYDEPLESPLPKLYHEKRDDSEKVRFRPAIPPQKEKKEHQKAAETIFSPQS